MTHSLDAPTSGVTSPSPTRQDDEANAILEEEDEDFDGRKDPEQTNTIARIRKIL